ncbi:MAG TPA: IS21-like element helper ATPase IstB, partial [Candidatus Wallbacteria bacterium]|nr:IS21-like element helper ATPase IstB [Candidatus Wallbacteria bacterium]
SNSYRRRLSSSRLNVGKTIGAYDFGHQPELDKKKIMDIAACRFIRDKKNVIFMGNPGVGKTHLANALGLEALKQGFKVQMVSASTLIDRLHASRADGTHKNALKTFCETDLLIIDELGFKKINQGCIDEFFEVISQRYEYGSTVITTNRSFEEWGQIFGDAVLASAIIDRLVHHAYIVKINGQSYRIKDHIKTGDLERKWGKQVAKGGEK